MTDVLRGKKAVVVFNKKQDKNILYWVGKKESFLNTHERKNNHGQPGHVSEITSFQYVPNNGIVMVKGSYEKGGETKKLSKIVGTLAKDQSEAEDYVKSAAAKADGGPKSKKADGGPKSKKADGGPKTKKSK
jgi:hypothetical protein